MSDLQKIFLLTIRFSCISVLSKQIRKSRQATVQLEYGTLLPYMDSVWEILRICSLVKQLTWQRTRAQPREVARPAVAQLAAEHALHGGRLLRRQQRLQRARSAAGKRQVVVVLLAAQLLPLLPAQLQLLPTKGL